MCWKVQKKSILGVTPTCALPACARAPTQNSVVSLTSDNLTSSPCPKNTLKVVPAKLGTALWTTWPGPEARGVSWKHRNFPNRGPKTAGRGFSWGQVKPPATMCRVSSFEHAPSLATSSHIQARTSCPVSRVTCSTVEFKNLLLFQHPDDYPKQTSGIKGNLTKGNAGNKRRRNLKYCQVV